MSSRGEAAGLAHELAVYAVEARIDETRAGHALTVVASDATLARHVLGLPSVATRDLSASVDLEPRRARMLGARRWAASLLRRPFRRLVLAAAAGATASMAAGALGLGLPSPVGAMAPRSGWSVNGQAFHDDGNLDGLTDRIVEHGADGTPRAIWLDTDQDGTLDRLIRIEAHELAAVVDLTGLRGR